MNKIGPDTSPSPSDNKNAKTGVVSSISRKRRQVDENELSAAKTTATLSYQAVDLEALEARIKQLPDIDAARVVELHNRIIAGEYEIDSDKLASKLIDMESSFDS